MIKVFESDICTVWQIEKRYHKVCLEEDPLRCSIWTGDHFWIPPAGEIMNGQKEWLKLYGGIITNNAEGWKWGSQECRVFDASYFATLRENPLIAALEEIM